MSGIKKHQTRTPSDRSESLESGIHNERILLLVFESISWDLQTLCVTASVNQKLRAIAKRLLWRELCVFRAPRMLAALTTGSAIARYGGGWHALAKLMFFCCGFQSSSRYFFSSRPSPGHFTSTCRFSKTSGRSFLTKKCREDLLFVSDPCEHPMGDEEDDLGIYRGVFQGFTRSRTRDCLIRRKAELEETVRCPYCGARVWSMTAARLVPKSAARRLGSHHDRLEYFVCVNGHIHGTCWLMRLSSDEDGDDAAEKDDDSTDDLDDDDDGDFGDNPTLGSSSSSSRGKSVVRDDGFTN